MPKYLVTASVDAFANYETVINAVNADEAREAAQAEWESNSLAWQRADISEFDHVDFDNIEPEEVADDFTLEPAEDLKAELLAALKAIVARIQGEWDSPELMAVGPLGMTDDDILHIAQTAITKAGSP